MPICKNANSRHRPCPFADQEQDRSEFAVSGKTVLAKTCRTCRSLRVTGRRQITLKVIISDMEPGNDPICATKEDEERYNRWLAKLANEVIR